MDTCSICLDDLTGLSNRLTTDCGHCFHTNCFLQNVSHNGFACPNCRNQLIEEPECDDDDEESYYDEEEDAEEAEYEEYEEAEIEAEEGDDYNTENYILRGSRWLFRRVEDDDDEYEDDEEDDDDEYDEDTTNRMMYERGHYRYNEEDLRPISLFEIGEKMKLCGITTEDMIALLAFPHKDNAVDIAAYPYRHLEEKRKQLDNIMREIPNVVEIQSLSTTVNDDIDDIHKSCLQNNSYYAELYVRKKHIDVSEQIFVVSENTSKMSLSELMCVDIDNKNHIDNENV